MINWEPGQNSALDNAVISRGVDIGNVTVIRETADGPQDVPYSVDFAFAFGPIMRGSRDSVIVPSLREKRCHHDRYPFPAMRIRFPLSSGARNYGARCRAAFPGTCAADTGVLS